MNTPRGSRLGMLAGLSLLICACFAQSAFASTVAADLRVVTDTGRTLTDVRQYTDTTAVPTSKDAKCFFNGKGGSGNPFTVSGPTALGIVADAARANGDLSPLLITDEYVGSLGSLGICGFGGISAKSDFSDFWQLRIDHKATQRGGDLTPVSNGDDVFWTLVPAPVCKPPDFTVCDPSPNELSIDVPARSKTGQSFPVTVSEYTDTGFQKPAAGATVTGASAPTDAAGKTLVTLGASGTVGAARVGALPSRSLPVCVAPKLKKCPARRGLPIFGSDLADAINGTPGADTIKAAGGDDTVSVRGGERDVVQCGGGIDSVRADQKDKIERSSCEKVKRFGKKTKKKGAKKKGARK